ncbi:hypothetical protein BaRGS_00032513, partial [Batillaria attramentaria]
MNSTTFPVLAVIILCGLHAGCDNAGSSVPTLVTNHMGHKTSLAHVPPDGALSSKVQSTVFDDTRDITHETPTSAVAGIYDNTSADMNRAVSSITKRSTQIATGSDTGNLATGSDTDNLATGSDTGNLATGSDTGNLATGSDTGNLATGSDTGNLATGSDTGNLATGSDTGNLATGSDTGNLATGSGTGNLPTGSDTGNLATGSDTGNLATGSDTDNLASGSDTGNLATGSDTGNLATGSDTGNLATGSDTGNLATGSDTGNLATGSDTGNLATGSDTGNLATGSDTGNLATGSDTGNLATGSDTDNLPTGSDTDNLATGSDTGNLPTGSDTANLATGSGTDNLTTGSDTGNLPTGSDTGNLATGSGTGNLATGSGTGNLATGSGTGNLATGSDTGNLATGSDTGNLPTGSDTGNLATGSGTGNLATGSGTGNLATGSCTGNLATGSGTGNLATGSDTGNLATGSDTGNLATGSDTGNLATGSDTGNLATGSDTGNLATGSDTGNLATGSDTGNLATGSDTGNLATGSDTGNLATGSDTGNLATGSDTGNLATGSDTDNLSLSLPFMKYDLHSLIMPSLSYKPYEMNYDLTNTTNHGGIIFYHAGPRNVTEFGTDRIYIFLNLKVKDGKRFVVKMLETSGLCSRNFMSMDEVVRQYGRNALGYNLMPGDNSKDWDIDDNSVLLKPFYTFFNGIEIRISLCASVHRFSFMVTAEPRPRLQLYKTPLQGYIQTPNASLSYPTKMMDFVSIVAGPGHTFMLSFSHFQPTDTSHNNDRVEIMVGQQLAVNTRPFMRIDMLGYFPGAKFPLSIDTDGLHVFFRSTKERPGVQGCGTGFTLQYSIHKAPAVPQRLDSGQWNCSVPYWRDFAKHLNCNMVVECVGGEDEVMCPRPSCGKGGILTGGRCFVLFKSVRKITWFDATARCEARGMRIGHVDTPELLRAVITDIP